MVSIQTTHVLYQPMHVIGKNIMKVRSILTSSWLFSLNLEVYYLFLSFQTNSMQLFITLRIFDCGKNSTCV
jgi:hypothetical protein